MRPRQSHLSMPLRGLALVTLSVAALLLVARSFHGPFVIGSWSVHTPINAQSFFGLSWVVLILTAALGRSAGGASREGGPTHLLLPAVLVIAVVAFLPGLSVYLLADDFYNLHDTHRYITEFPWPQSNHFLRPIGFLFLALVEPLRSDSDATLLHASCLGLHLAVTGLVYLLARRLRMSALAAFVAAATFAIHGARPESVVWISGCFGVLATLGLLAALLLMARDLQRPNPVLAGAWLLCALLAMWSKESAFVFPLLATLMAWTLGRLRKTRLALAYLLAAALFAYRWHVLGGLGGYQTAGGQSEALPGNLLSWGKVFAMRLWSSLLFPLNWSWEPAWWLSLLLLLGVGSYLILVRSKPDRRLTLFALAWLLLAALPASSQLLIGVDMEKSRGLYLPSVGFCLLLGLAVAGLPAARLRNVTAAALIVFQLGLLQHNLAIWQHVSDLARRTCSSTAARLVPDTRHVTAYNLPGILHGVYFFQHGFKECLDLNLPQPLGSASAQPGSDAATTGGGNTAIFRWDSADERLVPSRPR